MDERVIQILNDACEYFKIIYLLYIFDHYTIKEK